MKRHLPLAVAAAVAAVLFFALPPLGRAGVWDPHELEFAEVARRIALHSFHRADLAVAGANDAPVHAADLARPAMPYVVSALGFGAFGLHDWAGRAPLAIFGLLGVLAIYGAIARLVDRRAGLYAASILTTTPLYFVQARTMLGDVVPMASVAVAFAGLAVAVFDPKARRGAWLVAGAVGVVAGVASGGAMIGAGVPLTAIGAAWALARRGSDRGADAIGAAALAMGVVALAVGVVLLGRPGDGVSLWVGARVGAAGRTVGFEHVAAQLGHALAPWSALAPFALGRLFAPRAATDVRLRVAAVTGASVAFFVHSALAAHGAESAFSAPAILAVACALALRDAERSASTPRLAVALGTAALAFVLLRDFRALPETTFEVFAVEGAKLPDSFRHEAPRAWAIALGLFAAGALLAGLARDRQALKDEGLFDPKRYLRAARETGGAFDGALLQAYAAIVATTAVAAALLFVGGRAHARWVMGIPVQLRSATMHAWQVALVAPVVVFVVVPAVADAASWIARRVFAGRRGAIVVASGAAAGAILALWQYPALAAQLSSKAAYESYRRARHGDEPLALSGVTRRQLGSYEGASPPSFDDPRAALDWLADTSGGRRFVLASGERFGALNQLFRERTPAPHANLPVIDGRSSAIVLVASALAPGEASANPLDAFTLAARPSPQRPLRADLSGEVEVLGYDLIDGARKRVDTVTAGRTYRVRTYYEVLQRPTVAWQAFVHVDGHGRRHNADHAFLGGKYAPTSWLAGDLLVDEYELALPPNFTPGAYRLYFGFYQGERRLKVTSGPSDGQDRIDGGDIRVN